MIKVGEKAKGFRFNHIDNSAMLTWDEYMDRYIGVEGTIVDISDKSLIINDTGKVVPNKGKYFNIQFEEGGYVWSYPILEYLRINREERINELGI
jgi:RNase P/RNase MRP subunit p29